MPYKECFEKDNFVPAEGIFYVRTTDEAGLKLYAEPSLTGTVYFG